AAPTNDMCQNAVVIPSIPFDEVADVAGATTSAGESASCVPPAGGFVWYTFTASQDATLRASTCGSNYDTVLEVYSGDCTQRVATTCNDDSCDYQSSVIFTVTAGQ